MPARSITPPPAPAVLSYKDASHYLGLPSVGALRNMVYRKLGPPSIAYGKRDRRFPVLELDRWIDAKTIGAQLRQAVQDAAEPPARRRRGRPTKLEQAARRVGKP
jgi:hypothetical protein